MFPGEDILRKLEDLVREYKIKSGHLSLIGAVSKAKLGYFDFESKEYLSFHVDEYLEVVSCMGNISRTTNGDIVVHAHMIVSDRNGKCYAGHLMQGCEVSVTMEVIMTELEYALTRAKDSLTGLNLLDL